MELHVPPNLCELRALQSLPQSFVEPMQQRERNTVMTSASMQAAPQRNESDVYDRQIRLWGAEAQVSGSNGF
jgi:hypothetical protein